tara:strand:+ start:261 stop:1208 length:948 start_codon:yes stop_codon:yes gene_type:complete
MIIKKKPNLKFIILIPFFSLFGFILGCEVMIKLGGEYYLPIRRLLIKNGIRAAAPIFKPKEVNCPKDSLNIAYFGQSNSANSVIPKYNSAFPKNLYQFDWKSGKCFVYSEPLIGTESTGGNSITYAAIGLAEKYQQKKIIIMPFGVGRSSVMDWSDGYLSHFHDLVISKFKNSNLYPHFSLWHQGESDSKLDNSDKQNMTAILDYSVPSSGEFMMGLSKESYKKSLKVVADKTLNAFPDSKFGIALVSRCVGKSPYIPVRRAQQELSMEDKRIFISADSDKIYGKKYRYDKCHFSDNGAREIGNYYLESILSEIN